MAVGNVKGFKVKKGSETGIAKIATEAYLDQSVTKAKLAQAVQDEVDKVKDKADANGDYDDLTAGGAKQLLSTVYVDDNEPYNFRTSGGSADIGDRVNEEVVGGSIVWNQLYKPYGTTKLGLTITVDDNGIVTLNGTATSGWFDGFGSTTIKKDHVYIMATRVISNPDNVTFKTGTLNWNASMLPVGNSIVLKKTGSDTWTAFGCESFVADTVFNNVKFTGYFCDLTQMFGSTIADYIYSLEQGTAGAGVAWFRKLFPKPYYEYNAGELMSVKAGSHDTVGFNAWDEEWINGQFNNNTGVAGPGAYVISKNFSPCVPNTTYAFTILDRRPDEALRVLWYDKSQNFISTVAGRGAEGTERTAVSPKDAWYFKIQCSSVYGSTYKNNVAVYLAWDGERNGEYEPYDKHEYPLDELELRGIPKLDANNQLYYDGDTYASDGTVTRKYGIVDLGTLTWSYQSNYKRFSGIKTGLNMKTNANGYAITEHIVSSDYEPTASNYTASEDKGEKLISATTDNVDKVLVKDTRYTDVESFKNAVTGHYIVYELANPTTETADTYVNPQVVDDFGTEEYTDFAVEAGDRDVAIPVGHNSQYMNNLRAKLEMAPDSPSGDGKYIVQQTNGENAYIPYTADGRLDAIEAKLPAPPSANGTYKLTATVTDGSVVYAWVAG